MKLILTDHLKERLKLRDISEKIVEKIFEKSEEFYWDNLRNRHIVVSRVTYKGKLRKMLAAYDKIGDRTEIVSTHPITDGEIKNRLISGRWSYEKT
ncbi:hypothetical protein HYS96_04135 [Candidatus Daviesbacteria bacterium]|nr:hypothetical protein [Candidatus Daviesbacteria bacterium]